MFNKTGIVCVPVALRLVRVTIFAVEKQKVLHNLCVSVVLVIQHTVRMPRIILSSLACRAVPHFFHVICCTRARGGAAG